MEDAKPKKPVQDQQTIQPEGQVRSEDEVPEKDLDKVSGGPIYMKYDSVLGDAE